MILMGDTIMDSFEVEELEQRLEDAVDEAEAELEGAREELDRIHEYGGRLLQALGVSSKKAKFVYSVLDLEGDSRVESVTLHNLDVMVAEVRLTRQFRDVDNMRTYLEKRGIHGGDISREGDTYQLQKPKLGVAVYFSTKKE